MKGKGTGMRYCPQCFNWMNGFDFTCEELSLSSVNHVCTFCGAHTPTVRKILPGGWNRYLSANSNRTEDYLRAHLPSAQPVSGATLMGYYYNALRHWSTVQDHAAAQADRAQYRLAGAAARFDLESRAKLAAETTEDKTDGPR